MLILCHFFFFLSDTFRLWTCLFVHNSLFRYFQLHVSSFDWLVQIFKYRRLKKSHWKGQWLIFSTDMVLTWISVSLEVAASISGMKPHLKWLITSFLALDSQITYSSNNLDKASDNQKITKEEQIKRWWSLTTSWKELNRFKAFQRLLSQSSEYRFTSSCSTWNEIQSCWTGITSHTELPVNKRFKFI